MTDFTATNAPIANPVSRLFAAIWAGLIHLGENSYCARALSEISQLSDQDLEKMGVTRADMVQRVISRRYYL